MPRPVSRRAFLQNSALGLAAGSILKPGSLLAAEDKKPFKVAALLTEFTPKSHAHVILENFIEPYLFNGKRVDSGMTVVGMYVDQFAKADMARGVSKEYGIPIFGTIGETLRAGGKSLAVDGVLSIGEHGKYKTTDKRQVEYPRKRFFDEIVAEFKRSGKVVPVFNDKHLSYRSDWAVEMVETAKAMNFPFMAGSSVPLATRRPALEIEPGQVITEAVSIHGGNIEGYDFHGLEVLQAMVETRKGAETGIKEVLFLDREKLWKAADDGLWDPSLADAAIATDPDPERPGTLRELANSGRLPRPLHGILVTYKDGLKGVVLNASRLGWHWHFACKVAGKPAPLATSFYVGPWTNRNLFKALSHAIQHFFRTGVSPYPLARTLLTTVALDAAMDSRKAGRVPVTTKYLDVAYSPVDYKAFREMGDTWKIVTPDLPAPAWIDRLGRSH